ncbi:hypothetical protein [Corynebacterium sp.]|uniref:hypothetical protein n=1 Tax=Corynebacterium sp. TaxID=1720 RepID=UPI0026DB3432|nr:hypothetical protein [Corynebacterium sp.]MDO5031577.1 hypothetical protein [Corynebacterium sp.]
MPVALLASALSVAACQSTVGVGSDPKSAVQGDATPASSPQHSGEDKPAGTLVDFPAEVSDMAVVDEILAVRSAESLSIGTAADFSAQEATELPVNKECGDLTASDKHFVLACGDRVLLIDPGAPDSPQEIAMEEDSPVTVAAELSTGELFVGSHESTTIALYKDGAREDDLSVEDGSDQLIPVPNASGPDSLVRMLRADSTVQTVDWQNDRAGGRLRVGQGVGQISAGEGSVVVASDVVGKRLAIYTADDVVRLHQYGNTEGTPWAVAWDSPRQLAWVTTTDNNQLHAYKVASGVPELSGTLLTIKDAQNIAVLGDGTLVTASATGDGLQFITPDTLDGELEK